MTHGLSIPSILMTLSRVVILAVAASAIMHTSGGIRLQTSPSIENSCLMKSPLELQEYQAIYTLINTLFPTAIALLTNKHFPLGRFDWEK